MKSLIHHPFVLLPLMMIAAISSAYTLSAQENDTPARDKKSIVTIRIMKDINGETVKYDTTFEAGSDFDVDAFLAEKERFINGGQSKSARDFEFFDFEIPETVFASPNFPDSIRFDTVIKRFKFDDEYTLRDFPGHPGIRWNQMPDVPECRRSCPYIEKHRPGNRMPGCCPHFSPDLPEGFIMPELPGINFEPFSWNNKPEKIIIHKKKHGGKVVITFDNDDESECIKNEDVIIYRNDGRRPHNNSERRQYRQQNSDSNKEIEVEVKVDDTDDPGKGGKKVIIIEKKTDSDKK